MKKKTDILIRLLLGIPFLASAILRFGFEIKWAEVFFAIMLMLVCLYNLFLNHPRKEE